MLCLLDTWVSHNFITQESAEKMELLLEELKAPIQVHFADGIPHTTKLQAKDVVTPLWGKCEDETHTPKVGTYSPPGLPKTQSLITRVKTPCIEVFFILLESS
jgi:hypothetical protein